jgi:hypothetical protein
VNGVKTTVRNPIHGAAQPSLAPCEVELKSTQHGERVGVRGCVDIHRPLTPTLSPRGKSSKECPFERGLMTAATGRSRRHESALTLILTSDSNRKCDCDSSAV